MLAATNAHAVNLALLALRASLGAMILAHGLNKFFGGGRIPGTAAWFESIGMRPGRVNALLAATTEVGVGVLLENFVIADIPVEPFGRDRSQFRDGDFHRLIAAQIVEDVGHERAAAEHPT